MTYSKAAVKLMEDALMATTPYAVYDSEIKANLVLDALVPLLLDSLQFELDTANDKLARMKEDQVGLLPAWQTAHAMDMIDTFRSLGCRICHGVSNDPEIVLGPVILPGDKVLYCSMSLHETGWSYHFDFSEFGLPDLRCEATWEIPEELADVISIVVAKLQL